MKSAVETRVTKGELKVPPGKDNLVVIYTRTDADLLAGACVPAIMDDGQRMVAILNPENEAILFGFGKDEHGYFVFDWDGRPLVEACPSIDQILAVFK